MLLLSGVIGGWTASVFLSKAAPPGGLTFQQYLAMTRSGYTPEAPLVRPGQTPPVPNSGMPYSDYSHLPPSIQPPTMKPMTWALDSTFVSGSATSASGKALDLVSSDQRLEVQLQPGSLDLARATVGTSAQAIVVPVGGLTLQVSQLSGHFTGSLNRLGEYQLQVVDGSGKAVSGIGMHTPITLILHYQPWELQALNLDPNTMKLSWPTLIAAALQAKQSISGLSVPLQNDPIAHTLTAQTSILGPGPFDIVGPPDNQSPPKPHEASMQGNSGQLTYGYPLKVVPGAGGFTPMLSLNYSSGDPNSRSSATSPAGSVGDGWTLSMGSISASVYPTATAQSGTSAAPGTWYFMSGVANVSDRLVPNPSNSTSFLTEHISQLRIQQYTPSGRPFPCFMVWDTSGTYYEFGCTTDSIQVDNTSGTATAYRWDLDEMVAPSEGPTGAHKIIQVKYQQDCKATHVYGTQTFCIMTRDAGISKILYGYNASGTLTLATGSLPSIVNIIGTVDFSYLAPPYTTSTCASGYTPVPNSSLRCDDPADDSVAPVFGLAAPPVMSTLTLQSVKSYVGNDATIAYGYSFSYQDTPPTEVTEPLSQLYEYIAGEHLLTQVTPTIYQSGNAHQLKPLVLTYSSLADTYTDIQNKISTGALYSQQTKWSYLTQVVDLGTGMGNLITYNTAYSNSDGTPEVYTSGSVTDDRRDPFYCDKQPQDCTGNYAHPDDRAWSQQVVTQIDHTLIFDTLDGNPYNVYTTYNYSLAVTAQPGTPTCHPTTASNFCVGDNWTPKNTTTGVGDSGWVGHERGTVSGPFPLAPHRTVHAPLQRTRLSSLLRP